jgi:hypothetical protein
MKIETQVFDFPAFLKHLTGITGWMEASGPPSRVGQDYWYKAGKHEAYINVDQEHMSVAVDGESVFTGDCIAAQTKEDT